MRTYALIAALCSTAVAMPAWPQSATRTATIRTVDLDLSSTAGQAKLRHRVGLALESLCGSYANAPDPGEQDLITACRKTATADIASAIAARRGDTRLASAR